MSRYATPEHLAAAAALYGLPIPVNESVLTTSGVEFTGDLTGLLDLAEQDVTAWLGAVWDPLLVTAEQLAGLRGAVCAQALFRAEQGGHLMVGADDQIASLGALAFRPGAPPRLSPEVPALLAGLGLLVRSGTALPTQVTDA